MVLKKKKINTGRSFDGCREELIGIPIPLKYLPCNKINNRAGIIDGIGVKWLYICD